MEMKSHPCWLLGLHPAEIILDSKLKKHECIRSIVRSFFAIYVSRENCGKREQESFFGAGSREVCR